MVIDISSFLFLRHLRAEPTSHVLFFKDGKLKQTGPGLSFWFLPLGASVSAVTFKMSASTARWSGA